MDIALDDEQIQDLNRSIAFCLEDSKSQRISSSLGVSKPKSIVMSRERHEEKIKDPGEEEKGTQKVTVVATFTFQDRVEILKGNFSASSGNHQRSPLEELINEFLGDLGLFFVGETEEISADQRGTLRDNEPKENREDRKDRKDCEAQDNGVRKSRGLDSDGDDSNSPEKDESDTPQRPGCVGCEVISSILDYITSGRGEAREKL